MVPLSESVSYCLEALFSGDDSTEAKRLLTQECADNLPFSEPGDSREYDRIRFAVLKLSEGDISKLERAIDGAKCDWRDTLMAAGFGEDVNAHRQWFP